MGEELSPTRHSTQALRNSLEVRNSLEMQVDPYSLEVPMGTSLRSLEVPIGSSLRSPVEELEGPHAEEEFELDAHEELLGDLPVRR